MARTQKPLPFSLFFSLVTLVLFSISTPISLVHSLRPHKQQQFQELDISASLKKTLQVFSNEKAQPITNSSCALSFPLQPRDSIIKPKYESYSELITSRLKADSARSNFINLQLQRALSKSEYKMNIIQPEDLEAPITKAVGEYAARVGVGQPMKEFLLIADTGSDITWLQCEASESTTYRPISCESQQCAALKNKECNTNGACMYKMSYGDGSISIGDFATETMSFGNSGSVNNVAIGCARTTQGSFAGLSGILGLGGGVIALPSQIKATSFSYCLVDLDSSSSSTLEFNSAASGDSVLIPFTKNPALDVYYYVELTGITIADELIPIPASVYQIGNDGNGGIILDSGTTVTLLESQVYKSVRDIFVKYAQTQNLTPTSGVENLDTCYDLSSGPNVSLPTMSLQFSGGKMLSLPLENYFMPVSQSGKFCLAFSVTNQEISIIGNTQQKGFRVNYDLANKLIGFSPNKC